MQEVFAGIDAGGTRIKIGLASREGQLISQRVLETRDCQDAESLLNKIASELQAMANAAHACIVGAGMGCPGRIDFMAGRVVWLKSKLEFLEGIPLASLLMDRLGCPAVCDNDANTILCGEMRFGAGCGYSDICALTVGTGIGGAIALNGALVRGRNWAAGHFGFMSHDPYGPTHVCGNTGIAEEYGSQSGILRQVYRALKAGETSCLTTSLTGGAEPGFREIFEAADRGDALVTRLAERLTTELGVLIANLIYAFDPEVVLVGGGIVSCRPAILEAARHEALRRIDYLPQGATEILPMALGDAAGILGGVALAADALKTLQTGSDAQGDQR